VQDLRRLASRNVQSSQPQHQQSVTREAPSKPFVTCCGAVWYASFSLLRSRLCLFLAKERSVGLAARVSTRRKVLSAPHVAALTTADAFVPVAETSCDELFLRVVL
jgi:hypothetical protein